MVDAIAMTRRLTSTALGKLSSLFDKPMLIIRKILLWMLTKKNLMSDGLSDALSPPGECPQER